MHLFGKPTVGTIFFFIAILTPILLPHQPIWQGIGGMVFTVSALLFWRLAIDSCVVDHPEDTLWQKQSVFEHLLWRTIQAVIVWIAIMFLAIALFFPIPIPIVLLAGKTNAISFIAGSVIGTGLYIWGEILSVAYKRTAAEEQATPPTQ